MRESQLQHENAMQINNTDESVRGYLYPTQEYKTLAEH